MPRYIVQHFDGAPHQWLDVGTYAADDAGSALQQAFDDPTHKLRATTYRVAEEALTINVSINLDAVEHAR